MAEPKPKSLKVLFLSAEAAPLVKVGGLADVAGALPAEMRRRGQDVRIVLPLHPALRGRVAGMQPVAKPIPIHPEMAAIERSGLQDLDVLLHNGIESIS